MYVMMKKIHRRMLKASTGVRPIESMGSKTARTLSVLGMMERVVWGISMTTR